MKTKITVLLMTIAFLFAPVAFADENPQSKADSNNSNYLGPPDEAPRAYTFELHLKKFFEELFDLPWETVNPKQDFIPETPDRD